MNIFWNVKLNTYPTPSTAWLKKLPWSHNFVCKCFLVFMTVLCVKTIICDSRRHATSNILMCHIVVFLFFFLFAVAVAVFPVFGFVFDWFSAALIVFNNCRFLIVWCLLEHNSHFHIVHCLHYFGFFIIITLRHTVRSTE